MVTGMCTGEYAMACAQVDMHRSYAVAVVPKCEFPLQEVAFAAVLSSHASSSKQAVSAEFSRARQALCCLPDSPREILVGAKVAQYHDRGNQHATPTPMLCCHLHHSQHSVCTAVLFFAPAAQTRSTCLTRICTGTTVVPRAYFTSDKRI